MVRKAIVATCVSFVTAACSGGGSTRGEVTLKGQLLSSASAKQSKPLLLAMGWYPTFAGTAPGSPVGAVITQANIQFQGDFPVDFTFTLTGAPPAAALFDLSKTGGTGHLAYGILIAFRDVNKNGAFDANSAGKAEADDIVGISMPDPSRPPPEHSYFVVYLDGAPFTYDAVGEAYTFNTTQLQGTHSLSFAVPGRASETLSLTVPEAVTVSSPSPDQSFASGSTVAISWSPAAGTAYYDVYFLAEDGSGNWLYHTITNATSVTTPPISFVGPAHLTVKALAPLATGSQGSFVTPISQTSVRVSFTR